MTTNLKQVKRVNNNQAGGWFSPAPERKCYNYKIVRKQMRDCGGMISFILKTKKISKINKFFKALKLFTLAESLGGVESLISHPATMTHSSISAKERDSLGISINLIRLSVGIEDYIDLTEDLRQSLDKI